MNDDGRKHRKLSNLLLNRRFQLKYSSMIVGLSTLISFALGVFLVGQIRENSRMLQLEAELDSAFQEQLAVADAERIATLVGALVLFNVLLFFAAVFVTHKMAGPIFVFKRYLTTLAEGRIPDVRPLRKGDEFNDVLLSLQHAVGAIRERTESDVSLHMKVLEQLSGHDSPEVDTIRSRLQARIDGDRTLLHESRDLHTKQPRRAQSPSP